MMDHGQMGGMSGMSGHMHAGMIMDRDGMVMNNNEHTLPDECKQISADYHFTVHAGTKYAAPYPGTVFGITPHIYRVKPCSRLKITFINEDQVRHQFMVHGLPVYLYPQGMFHIEANGGVTKTGTFIVPGDDQTYLVHCDLAQHMEKGMKGELIVGRGSGQLTSIPGVTSAFRPDVYEPASARWLSILLSTVPALLIIFGLLQWVLRRTRA